LAKSLIISFQYNIESVYFFYSNPVLLHTLTFLINIFNNLCHTTLSHDYLSHVKTDIKPYNHTNT